MGTKGILSVPKDIIAEFLFMIFCFDTSEEEMKNASVSHVQCYRSGSKSLVALIKFNALVALDEGEDPITFV